MKNLLETQTDQHKINIYSSKNRNIIHHTTPDKVSTYYCNTTDTIHNGNNVVAVVKVNGKSVLINGDIKFNNDNDFVIIDTGLSKLYYANDMIRIIGKVEKAFTRGAIKN